MKIAIGCDHGALELKQLMVAHLEKAGHTVEDFGTHTTDSCDYPDFALAAATAIANGECTRGLFFCSTGIGISMAANKVKGIRAACVSEPYSAHFTRLHNDANILALGGRVVGEGLALKIVDTFLDTPFSNEERHIRRIGKIEDV